VNVPVGALLREVFRAEWSRPVWMVVAVLASITIGGALGAVLVMDAGTIEGRERWLTARGWGVVAVSSADGGTFDARACAVVAEVAGVRAAGAVGATREVSALGLEAGLALTTISVDAAEIAWPALPATIAEPVVLTPGFVSLSGVGEGTLHLAAGGALVPAPSIALDGGGRYPALDGGVLLLRTELVDATTCLADVPGARVESLALDIAAAAVSYGVVAVPVVSGDDATPTPDDLVRDYRARGYPVMAAAFLTVVGALRLLRSRRDRAVYRLLDVTRGDLVVMGLVDFAVVLAAPMLSSFATVLLVAEHRGTPTGRLGPLDLGLLLAATVVVGLGYAFVHASGRNRHQFAPGA
jgi:hypothetical protein